MLTCLLASALCAQPDLDAILKKADALLKEALDGYEAARAKASVPDFIQAGFKLEEARIKYLVLQEVGNPEQQKAAAARLREVQQLAKLINDGKVAVAKPPVPEAPPPADVPPSPEEPAPAPAPETPPAPTEEAAPKRLPLPDENALKEAETLILDLFKDAYAKKDWLGRRALARLLLEHRSKVAGDPPAAYVLFREAADAAVEGNDIGTACRALEELSHRFDVDGPALRLAALGALGKAVRTPDAQAQLAEAYLDLVDAHMEADEYPPAQKAAAAALLYAKKSGQAPLAALALERRKEVVEASARFSAMKKVVETLGTDPADPGANLEMGRYLCFTKGNWDSGLLFLAQGSDEPLRNLAVAETAGPVDPQEILKVADGWFDLYEKEPPSLKKRQVGLHARALYESVLPHNLGLTVLRIRKRLEALPLAAASRYGAAVDLMPLVDLSRAIAGDWRQSAGVYLSGTGANTRVPILYQVPDEYDLVIGLKRADLGGSFTVGLGSHDIRFAATLDGFAPKVNGFQPIDGRSAQDNPSTHRGSVVKNNIPIQLRIRVRRDEVSLDVDGRRISAFKGDITRLGNARKDWDVPGYNGLYLASWGSVWAVSKLELTPQSPGGRPLK